MKLPAFIGVLTGLQSRMPLTLMRLRMNTDWLIFNVNRTCVTCHLIIIFIFPRSLILYSFYSFFLIQSNPFCYFDIRKMLSTYILTIVILFSLCRTSILKSMLNATKPRFVKNITTFWFHNLPDCLKPYMLHNKRITKPSLIALKDFIFGGNFMKIDIIC